MGIIWVEKQDLIPAVYKGLTEAGVVLDIGCGIRPQNYVRPLVHICCEPCDEYVEQLRKQVAGQNDSNYVVLRATWAEAVKLFPRRSVDSVFLIDVIEHLEKEEASRLLYETERLVRKQIVIFTPLGFLPQKHPDGKDAWGLSGGIWQEHRSGWVPEEFDESWEIYASRVFHDADNTGKKLQAAHGAFWAVKTFGDIGTRDPVDMNKKRLIRLLLDRLSAFNESEIRMFFLASRVYCRMKRIFGINPNLRNRILR